LSDRSELKSNVKKFDVFVLLIPNRQPHQFNKIVDDDLSEIIEPTEFLFNLLSQENKKLVFASTGGAVYGDSKRKTSYESNICKPMNQYGKYKLRLEESLTSAQKQNQFDADILRISNPYGGHFNHYFTSGLIDTFELISKVNKSTLDVFFDYNYVEEVPYNVLSTAKSENILSYSPKLDLKSGIELEKIHEF
jgi:UDP-glucose 4-epimerase